MLFSSLVFLYGFLPLVVAGILLSPRRWHNLLLLIASLFFYAWGGVSYTLVLLFSILLNYGCGRLIDRLRGRRGLRWALAAGVTLNLLLLVVFKYAAFIVQNINDLLGWAALPTMPVPDIALPLGISFYTFQAISYLVDVYRWKMPAQQRLTDLALYIALFPQLIAGPVVRYHDIAGQLRQRRINWDRFGSGLERFILGLGKKVLLANRFALVADEIFAIHPANLDPLTAWAGVVFYALQIYFDFSGYSDMAIGLGRLFGFELPENFNFPYVARSVREFWRRWHISLSQWFRDYLYIPLGGNRVGPLRTYLHLGIVFFLTGLWHGASWNFVIWGLLHGAFMVAERLGLEQALARAGRILQHTYTLMVILLTWVFFRADNLWHAGGYLRAMAGFQPETAFRFDLAFYFDLELWLVLTAGLAACTPFFRNMHRGLLNRLEGTMAWSGYLYGLTATAFLLLIWLYSTMSLVSSAYNPFIYFRF